MGAPAINVLDPQFYVDPWSAYALVRDEAPVFWDPVQELWVVSRYDDIVACEKDAKRYSSFKGSRPLMDQSSDESMINLDDPDHQAQRNLVARRFTPRAVKSHEDHVRQIVTELLDAVVPVGRCEVIETIVSRLPAMMIAEILGFPPGYWEKLRHWSEQMMLLSGQTSPAGRPYVTHPDMIPVLVDYQKTTTPLIEARRAEPRDDIISTWCAEGWSTKKLLDEIILVVNGGAETTRTVIGSMIHDLAAHPEQRRLLVEHPELLQTTAIEEFIRWVSPVLNMRRTATEDHDWHAQSIRAGDEILLLYPSGNRDDRVYEQPERLDVTRPNNRHIAFGFGPHFCLGAHLARLELRVLFEEFLRRIPEWELVGESHIVPATFARAYDKVEIRFPAA